MGEYFWVLTFFFTGGTLRVALSQSLRHLNSAVQSGMATAVPASQLFASLLRYDDEWNPQPYLATDWEWVDDGLGNPGSSYRSYSFKSFLSKFVDSFITRPKSNPAQTYL